MPVEEPSTASLAEVAMPAEEPALHIDLGGDNRIDLARRNRQFQLMKG